MIKVVKKKKVFNVKTKIINILMLSGKKNTSEKILARFVKKLQKNSNKRSKNLIQLAIINSTSAFKLNEQVIKRGKRKAVRNVPSFLSTDSLRIMMSLKAIKQSVAKNRTSNQFYEALTEEVLSASVFKGQSVEKKLNLQNQILANKRYLANFKW